MSSQSRGGFLLTILAFVSLQPAYARTPASPAAKADKEPVLRVTHRDEDENGWRLAESANFRLFHQQSRTLAENLLRTAERTRAEQQRKWFGAVGADWQPRCRIVLYPSGQLYSETTGASASPSGGGHTDIRLEDERVVGRCMHLHGSRNFLLGGLLPHEVTHAVLAGRFGGERVPRWADEGMAVLAEEQPHIDRHLHLLPRWRDDELLVSSRDLIQMHDYPAPRAVGAFYAQSVSLVDFLTRQKGARRFAAFVRDGERGGYAESLKRHYGWTYAELDRHWQSHAFGEQTAETTTISGGG